MRLSREVEALIAYVASTGVPYRVTSTTGGTHAPTSRHFMAGTDGAGLAADFAGPGRGDIPAMTAIYQALLERSGDLRELIFWVPGETRTLVRRGVKLPARLAYSAATRDAHRNHVHASVTLGTFLQPKETAMADDETLPNITGPIELHIVVTDAGDVRGYYMFSPTTGELHSFGDVPFFGRSEVAR